MKLDKFMYLYPPRPRLMPAIPAEIAEAKVNELEVSGDWVGEPKFNGDNTQVWKIGKEFQFWNRDGSRLAYQPSKEVSDSLNSCELPSLTDLNGELLHNRHKSVKHTIVLYLPMVLNGETTTGMHFDSARNILGSIIVESENVFLAPQIKKGFWETFKSVANGKGWPGLDMPPDIFEGIVFKKKLGIVTVSAKPQADVSWMLKIRKPSGRYAF